MSGIFGIVQLDGQKPDPRDLERMQQRLAHRGPNGCKIWTEGPTGLGQLMLCTTVESLNETLPWKDSESGVVITADARVDNRDELLRKLHLNTNSARELPDSQIILAAFLQWGESCVDHLLGDFAFAIWDPHHRQLFCARDHMGIRPFYYYQSGSLLVFASSAQAVVAVAAVPERISDERVADFLAVTLEGVNNRCTFFNDVWRMPPAHTGTFSHRGLSISSYWKPDAETEIKLGSDEEYTEAFEEVLTASVKARLRSHRPLAAMVSGGIDSSTIACLARDLLEQSGVHLRTYSGISDDESECRETHNIRSVIAQGGFESRLLRPSDIPNMAEDLRRVSNCVEDPFDNHSTLLTVMYLAASADGSAAVMGGLDGDGIASLTSIYPSYLVRDGNWVQASREIRGLWKNYYQGRFPLWHDYLDAVRPLLAPEFYWKKRWAAGCHRMALAAVRDSFFSQALLHHVDLSARFREYFDNSGTSLAKTLRAAHVARVLVPYLTAAIERFDRLAACCGVEQRQPLLDKLVVEFCVGLPWRQKVRDGWSKHSLRRVAQHLVPHEVAWRRGWDALGWKFVAAWHETNRHAADELLQRELSCCSDYVDVSAFHRSMLLDKPAVWRGEKVKAVHYLVQWLAHQRRASLSCVSLDQRSFA